MKRIVCFSVLVVVGPFALWFASGGRDASAYRGWTAAQWESEIRRWSHATSTSKGCLWAHWYRESTWWERWLERIGVAAGSFSRSFPTQMPLLEGDAEAVPVLVELLRSKDSNVRRLAAQALQRSAEHANSAVPDLIIALDDEDRFVRIQAEQALFRIDPEAAQGAGLEWMFLGGIQRRGKSSD
jgi:HEAT repeats